MRFGFRNLRKQKQRGFTLIELLMVITVLGILAAIALSQFTLARMQSYNASAKSDLKNAYTAAQAYFGDNPTGDLSSTDLQSYGFRVTDNVNLVVVNGRIETLSITAAYSITGSQTYTINSTGTVTP